MTRIPTHERVFISWPLKITKLSNTAQASTSCSGAPALDHWLSECSDRLQGSKGSHLIWEPPRSLASTHLPFHYWTDFPITGSKQGVKEGTNFNLINTVSCWQFCLMISIGKQNHWGLEIHVKSNTCTLCDFSAEVTHSCSEQWQWQTFSFFIR